MAQTFTAIYIHAVFSTKNRTDFISDRVESGLYSYMRGIAENFESPILAAGGTANHVHLLISLSKMHSLVELMMDLKKDSSKWIKTQGREFGRFHWQEGYGAFSIGESGIPALKKYIANQKQHHRRVSFQDEYLRILKKYRIEYDERYIWK